MAAFTFTSSVLQCALWYFLPSCFHPERIFLQHLQRNLLIILLKISKAYFWPAHFFFFLPMAELSHADTPIYLSNQDCFIASFCYPICLLPSCLSHFACKLSRAGLSSFSSSWICTELCIRSPCSATRITRDFEKWFYYCYCNNHTWGSYNTFFFPYTVLGITPMFLPLLFKQQEFVQHSGATLSLFNKRLCHYCKIVVQTTPCTTPCWKYMSKTPPPWSKTQLWFKHNLLPCYQHATSTWDVQAIRCTTIHL